MQRFEVNTQTEFERAFFQEAAEIVLMPGVYDIPHPDDPTKLYCFTGVLLGTGRATTDVRLRGGFIAKRRLVISNLVLDNVLPSLPGLFVGENCVATLTDVALWNDNADNPEKAIVVGINASLLTNNILIDYQSVMGISVGTGSTVALVDSGIQSLECSAVMIMLWSASKTST